MPPLRCSTDGVYLTEASGPDDLRALRYAHPTKDGKYLCPPCLKRHDDMLQRAMRHRQEIESEQADTDDAENPVPDSGSPDDNP